MLVWTDTEAGIGAAGTTVLNSPSAISGLGIVAGGASGLQANNSTNSMWHYTAMGNQSPQSNGDRRGRHRAFDELRGLVIVLMTLDHVRGFVTPTGADPMNWQTTTVGFFLVRWMTHLCAPVFVILMGAAAALRHRSRPSDSRSFLVSRGVWLIALEASWISFSWSWDPKQTYFGVLWALGGSMVLLALVIEWRREIVMALGLGLLVGLEWLQLNPDPGWLRILVKPGEVSLLGHTIRCSYPLLPWFGAAAIGWSCAEPLKQASPTRLAMLGAGALVAFVTYRYGTGWDPNPWGVQASIQLTVADFLSPSKYPPSLAFYLLTGGVGLLILAGAHRRGGRVSNELERLGRVPMMFYLLHLPIAHALGNVYAWIGYGQTKVPASEPTRVWVVLVAWALVVALLLPACARWDAFKRRRRDLWWLGYL